LFIEHSRRRQAIALFVAPVVFGVLGGFTLKWSLVAWWTMQVIGLVGAVFPGREQSTAGRPRRVGLWPD
jgi:di/tricarboxylate transporter